MKSQQIIEYWETSVQNWKDHLHRRTKEIENAYMQIKYWTHAVAQLEKDQEPNKQSLSECLIKLNQAKEAKDDN